MALRNVLLLSQIAGYVIGLILSLCIIVPMSMHLGEFNGHCLLFSHGDWEQDGQLGVVWASRAYCDYVVAVGVLMFLTCSIQIYRLSIFMYKGMDSSFLSAFLEAVGCMALCGFTVAAAVIVTLGFMTWCQNIVERFPSCEDAAGQNIDKFDNITTSGFYMEIGSSQGLIAMCNYPAELALGDVSVFCWKTYLLLLPLVRPTLVLKETASMYQFGTWAAFATWVGLAVFSTIKVCRYHQLENIQVSMYRERQRLVNASDSPTAPDGRSTPPIDIVH